MDDFGLVAALEWQAQDFSRRTGIESSFRANVDSVDLESGAATAVFRVFQETLTNVARHAEATRVQVDLTAAQDGSLTLSIADNGRRICASAAAAGAIFPASPAES